MEPASDDGSRDIVRDMYYAFLFSRLSGRDGTRGDIDLARIECPDLRR